MTTAAPALPPRPITPSGNAYGLDGRSLDTNQYQRPPQRRGNLCQEDVAPATRYARDPYKLTAYIVPFPTPELPDEVTHKIPRRFMIYTPPQPPFRNKPENGKREGVVHWTKRHWNKHLREAEMRSAKPTVLRRVKWRVTLATAWGMNKTKSSNLEFLNRIADMQDVADERAEDCYSRRRSLETIVLVYPSTMGDDMEELSEELSKSMLRTKRKAYKDSCIAAVLFPPALLFDTIVVPVWPFGGLAEVDAVWLYASARGAKTSRAVTKRLRSTAQASKNDGLDLQFVPSPDLGMLEQYLRALCHKRNHKLFPGYAMPPSETQLLQAIGWSPSEHGDEKRDWHDEQWEVAHTKYDIKNVFGKGAREWCKWCESFAKATKGSAERREACTRLWEEKSQWTARIRFGC